MIPTEPKTIHRLTRTIAQYDAKKKLAYTIGVAGDEVKIIGDHQTHYIVEGKNGLRFCVAVEDVNSV